MATEISALKMLLSEATLHAASDKEIKLQLYCEDKRCGQRTFFADLAYWSPSKKQCPACGNTQRLSLHGLLVVPGDDPTVKPTFAWTGFLYQVGTAHEANLSPRWMLGPLGQLPTATAVEGKV